jgi:predicted metalloprotease with PDZ domain
VHEQLYKRFGSGARGFTDADILAILRGLTGRSWDAWWAGHIQSPGEHDFDALLEPVGLRLIYPDPPKAWAGWRGSTADGGMQLDAVQQGSPAWNAGFEAGDLLVAADGQRLSESRFNSFLAEHKPGDEIRISFFRRDQLMQKVMKIGVSKGTPRIVPVENPSASQKALFERWLLVPYAT